MATGTSRQESPTPPSLDYLVNEIGVPRKKLKKPCSDDHLLAIAPELTDWEDLCPYLRLRENEVEAIKSDSGTERRKRLKCLREWKKKYGMKATYKVLIEALLECKVASHAEKVCRLLAANPEDSSEPAHGKSMATSSTTDMALASAPTATNVDPILWQNIMAEIRTLEKKYDHLVNKVQASLIDTDISEVKDLLIRMPNSLKHLHQKLLEPEAEKAIVNTTSIRALFTLLYKGYWDSLNCGLLHHIVDRLGNPKIKESMEMYLDELRTFRTKTKLKDMIPWGGPRYTEISPVDLVLKLGKEWEDLTLEDLEQFRNKLAVQFFLKDYTMPLLKVEQGCITVTFGLPTSVDITALHLQDLQEFLKQHHVLRITAGGHCIIDTTIPKPKVGVEQSALSKEKEQPQLPERRVQIATQESHRTKSPVTHTPDDHQPPQEPPPARAHVYIGSTTKESQAIPEPYRGYDCEFTVPPTDVFHTTCPVCLCILRDPYETNCCGTSFCYACLKRFQATGKSCPACCCVGFSIHASKGLKKSLIQLHVYCTHRKDGCEWTGKLGQLDGHLNINPEIVKHHIGCGFVEIKCIHCKKSLQRRRHPFDTCPKRWVPCTNEEKGCAWVGELSMLDQHLNVNLEADQRYDGCGFVVLKCMHGCGQSFERHELHAHESDCLERQYLCEYCREYESTFRDVTRNHFKECRKYPIPCPKECGHLYAFERQNLQDHLNRDCPLEVIECHFCFAGCKAKLQRKEMPAHLDENTNNHLSLLAAHSSDMSKQVEEDRRQIAELEEKFTRTIQEKNDLETAKSNLDSEICQLRDETATKLVSINRLVRSKTDGQEQQIDRLKYIVMAALVVVLAGLVVSMITRLDQELRKNQEQMEILQNEQKRIQISHLELRNKQEQMETCHLDLQEHLERGPVIPVTFTMDAFSQHKRDNDTWYSEPFYTHPNGYKMCLRVDANGNGKAKGTHVSVFVCLMPGEFDNSLEWPFRGNITIQLLNQLEDSGHRTETIPFTDKTPDTSAGRVTTGGRGEKGWGHHKFISPWKLKYYSRSKNRLYLKDDSLLFRVTKQSQFVLHQEFSQHVTKVETKRREMGISFSRHLCIVTSKQEQISKLFHISVVPVTITMADFEKHKRDDDIWFSYPFYTHPHGYKMCLRVDANGYSNVKGTHVSVFVYLMRGRFDDHLKWPFRGDITIQLLNQLEDKEHHTMTFSFDDRTPDSSGRVTTGGRGKKGWGWPKFISHNNIKDSGILKDDRLFFRVRMTTEIKEINEIQNVVLLIVLIVLCVILCLFCCCKVRGN